MKHKLLTILAASSVIFGLTACDGTDDGELTYNEEGEIVFRNVNISFQHVITGVSDQNYLIELINEFNDEYDGQIQVTATATQPEDLYDSLPLSTNNNRNADVVLMHAERVLQFAGQTNSDGTSIYFRELEDIMELAKIDLDENDFPSQVWDNMQYNGHQYGIPFDLHMAGIYVNTTILDELGLDLPETREELIAAAKAAIAAGYQGLPLSNGYPDTYYYINAYFNYGGIQMLEEGDEGFDTTITTSDGTVVPAQPGVYYKNAAFNAVSSFRELLFDEGISESQLATDANLNYFYNGNSLFCYDGIWLLNDVIRYAQSANFEFTVIPSSVMFNSESNTEYTGDIYTNGHIFVMPKNSMGGDKETRQQASMVFIQWMLEHSADWAASGKIAAYSPARETEEYQAIEYLDGFGDIEDFRAIQPNKYTYSAFSPSQQANTMVLDSSTRPTDAQIEAAIAEYYQEGIDLVMSDMASSS